MVASAEPSPGGMYDSCPGTRDGKPCTNRRCPNRALCFDCMDDAVRRSECNKDYLRNGQLSKGGDEQYHGAFPKNSIWS